MAYEDTIKGYTRKGRGPQVFVKLACGEGGLTNGTYPNRNEEFVS